MTYNPEPETKQMLDNAYKIIKSVPYKPSDRWLFYQFVQRAWINKDLKEWNKQKRKIDKARKSFYEEWNPLSLSDDTRQPIIRGLPEPPREAIPDRIKDQEYYVELWYEARAMTEQFWYYTKDYHVTMVPFGGDYTISPKWKTAKRLENRIETYKKPVVILYFGDCDEKGNMIPKSALKDIQKWCKHDFKFIRCGLTLEQAKRLNLPENPERPGQYQWEAANDKDAGKLILGNLKKYWKKVI
jgi:hypothetical protein